MDVGSAIPSRKGSPSVDSRQRHPSPPRLLPIQFVNSNQISPHVPVFLHRPISAIDLGLPRNKRRSVLALNHGPETEFEKGGKAIPHEWRWSAYVVPFNCSPPSPPSHTHVTDLPKRSWHDADDQVSPLNPSDPLELPLKKGEFGITDIEHRTRHIVPESEYELVDRTFRVGDVCKRGIDDVASAVVLEVRCELRLKHAISGVPVEGWIPGTKWRISRVSCWGITLCATIGLDSSGCGYGRQVCVGDRGTDILPATGHPPSRQAPRNAFLKFSLACWPSAGWLSTNGSPPKNRPIDQDRNRYGVVKTQHRGESGRVLEVETMVVTESRSTAKIMWQDGIIEEVLGTAIIPYLNVDEYDCWYFTPFIFSQRCNNDAPGQEILSAGRTKTRPEWQSSSPPCQNRTAKVMWYGTSPPQTETVSVLELDPHGPSGTETFGVRRGDFVFLHRPGTTNGAQLPAVPRIGELEEWVREPPPMAQQPHPSHTHTHSHSDENGHFHVYSDGRDQSGNDLNLAEAGWRGVMAALGMKLAEEGASQEYFHTEQLGRERRVVKVHEFKGGSIRWFGEVMNLTTGGLIQVVLPHGEVVEVPLERVTLLNNEGFDELGGWQDGDLSADEGSSYGSEEVMEEVVYPDGQPLQEEEVDGWETEGSEDEDMESAGYIPGSPIPPEPLLILRLLLLCYWCYYCDRSCCRKGTSPSLPSVPGPSTSKLDHAYYGHKTTSAQPPKSFMTRLAKEYKVLASSFTYRHDLGPSVRRPFRPLRCLIIGPQNTPYEDAPFVIDWFLDSSFSSISTAGAFLELDERKWTRNLYEEGKVCLSILGRGPETRASPECGEVVAVTGVCVYPGVGTGQGAVSLTPRKMMIVTLPRWFCEPAYDKLRGTEEGIVNRQRKGLRPFQRIHTTSLGGRSGGLETEIEWYYIKQGRLARAIEDARALVARSEAGEYEALKEVLKESDPAVGVLSEGAVIMLRRTLDKLDAILKERTKSS
ncbi:Ubiquitin-conjugating enzyme E2 [Rhizoctonia solani]|uniref:Ubiquitin-conjugating enzyme E2 n=1 Tax=Rhizoctonia solani TaxID=456999 RepID=A0A8H7IDW5_9AGAM|nr:Ubiquitin-conjugating enzyme E2 [Rhizoctonia solani]